MESTHALPRWFVRFQDTAGLSLLVIALMGINGIVYASGVVKDVERPDTWGLFGTVLFVLFFAAGAAMPGIALRAGVGIFVGSFLRRVTSAGIALMFFILEVWASVTERSLMTFTTPADRWLLTLLHMPNLPFSPTVFALSLAISIAVIAWGIVVTPPARESEDEAAHKERLKTLRAQAKAERRRIFAESIGSAGRAAIQAAKAEDSAQESLAIAPSITEDSAPDMPPDGGGNGTGKRRLKSVTGSQWTKRELQEYASRRYAQNISDEQAVAMVRMLGDGKRMGRAYVAHKRSIMAAIDRQYAGASREANAAG